MTTIYYGVQTTIFGLLLISIPWCAKNIYESVIAFGIALLSPFIALLINLGLNIWATVLRWNRDGRIASEKILEEPGHFIAVWVIVTYGAFLVVTVIIAIRIP